MIKMNQKQLKVWTPPLNAAIITDLDGCAVDSSHRQHCLPNGQLDLDNWREHCGRVDVEADNLLPWGERLVELAGRQDLLIGVCTSRVVNEFDLTFIRERLQIATNCGLIWTRPTECRLGDAELKELLFTNPRTIYGNFELTLALNLGKLYFVDDLIENCRVAENLGLQAIHAV